MKFLRLGICALISFAVAAHGGVEDWARAILEAGVAFLFLVWALRFYFNEKEQRSWRLLLSFLRTSTTPSDCFAAGPHVRAFPE